MKWISYSLLLIVAGALAYLGYQKFFPSEEKRVRLLLADVAEAASFSSSEKPFTRLTSVNKLADCFSADAEINVQVTGEGSRTIQGREEIRQIALAARSSLSSVLVEFLDVIVELGAEKESATVELTAKVTQSGERDFGVQELKVLLKKIDGTWRITRLDTVRTLGR